MRKILLILAGTVFAIASICIAGYPFISNYINSFSSKSAVSGFLNSSEQLMDEEIAQRLNEANEYNDSLVGRVTVGDPFAQVGEQDSDVADILKADGSSAIATLNIPTINVNLPVFYGTDEELLHQGVGLLQKTSLPVGGESNHSVITGHTGYSFLSLFSDLNQLGEGDMFYINTLGETLAYQVDNTAVVLPTDTELLQIESGKDYVTLVTCTPFGVNSHRLLVRGTRVPYVEGEEAKIIQTNSTWNQEYATAIFGGVLVMLAILFVYAIIRLIIYLVRKRKRYEE